MRTRMIDDSAVSAHCLSLPQRHYIQRGPGIESQFLHESLCLIESRPISSVRLVCDAHAQRQAWAIQSLAETARTLHPLELHSGATHTLTAVRAVVPHLYRLATVGMYQRRLGMHMV